ncbi:MAG: nuclease-related domain-containing protein [Pseudomonadota bacterium]
MSKSPIKAKPLRNPGQSLDRRLVDILLDDIVVYLMAAGFLVVVAMQHWLIWFTQKPPNPWYISVAAAIAVIVATVKIRKSLKTAKNVKLGLEGERAVGQYLDRLHKRGALVLHDIPGEGFNLDHVVIDVSGIYLIETRTLSKPDRGQAKLTFNGERIFKGQFELARNPIIQVLAGTRWLRDLLESSTGRQFPIRPVVVFPGWYVEKTQEAKQSSVWVLEPKALPSFIENSGKKLKPEDVNLCAFHLARYIRSS